MPSNSSGPAYNSKSLLSPATESPAERDPRTHPAFLTLLWCVLAVAVQSRLCFRDGTNPFWPGLFALVSILAIALGGMSLWRGTVPSRAAGSDPTQSRRLAGGSKPGAKIGHAVILAGGVLGFVVSVPFGVWTLSAAILILAPLFLPIVVKLGIDPIHFGIIIILNIEVAFLTPPFGLNLFVASGITGKGIIEVARSAVPYLLIMYGVLFLITYVPWISLALIYLIE